jgi:hypothetical protein
MTIYSRWQATIVDEVGDAQAGASVAVYRESDGVLSPLKQNRAGSSGLTNPATADSDGFVFFYAPAGRYRIVATKDGFSREWRDVPLGTAQEVDVDSLSGDVIQYGSPTGVRFIFDSSTSAADPGTGEWRSNSGTFASITALYLDNAQFDGDSVTTWLDALDDRGSSSLRGTLRAETLDDPSQWAEFDVTGSVVDSTGYRTLTVTPKAQVGWPFTAASVQAFTFAPPGPQGEPSTVPGPTGEGLDYDQIVADITERDAVTTPVGVRVAVSDIGDGRSAIYELLDDSPQTWSDPLYISGSGGTGSGVSLQSTTLAFLTAI